MSVSRMDVDFQTESFENNTFLTHKNSQMNLKKSKQNRVFGHEITNVVDNQIHSNGSSKYDVSKNVIAKSTTLLATENEVEEEMEVDSFSSLLPCDEHDLNNELAVVPYIASIMQHFRESEVHHALGENNDYMETVQKDISPRMRAVLLDWIVEVHLKFKLSSATLYLAVNILDRFLAVKESNRSVLQLTGCACLWIACKYQEIYAPEIRDYVYISDNAFSKNDLIQCEADIMEALDFQLTVPTSLSFAERFIKVATFGMKPREGRFVKYFTMYLLEHCLMDYNMARKLPSAVASAAICFVLLVTRFRSWDEELVQETGHTLADLTPTLQYINGIVNNRNCKHKAIRKKYCSSKFDKVEQVLKNLIPIDINRYVRHAESKVNPQ